MVNVNRRQKWAARVEEYRASGLTLKRWCEAHGCTMDQMKYWLYKSPKHTLPPSTEASTAPPVTPFVPLAVMDEERRTSLILRIGLAEIELDAGFDPQLLREVVHALAEAVPC
ncbi:IS66 family insertion sequence element accessory protein TnpA [Paenibacillus koleovorans]|uniref:IS66 family insertion sequence element accessory protein TnpA n=1 Tax=Paenibacillus koleovorans TaxID=121608 RepID=UPI000FD70F42|nr:hypothetical protein [Paenibacillus koleovorans]